MGKVPVVVHDGTPVAELGAIAIYLSDRFPDAGLAPAIDDPKRADYLRWCFFASAIIEPCLGEKFFKWEIPAASVAWGSFDRMMTTLTEGLKQGPYLLGDQFSAADVLVGSNVRFGHMFGAIPNEGVTAEYVARLTAREACARAAVIERREGERFPPTK
jgi:glutathione S-transferase